MVGKEGHIGICPQLEGVVGQDKGQHSWKTFIEYGSKTSEEYTWAWNQFKSEAENIWQSLGIEPSGVLAAAVEDSGAANTDPREITEN